MSADFSIPFSKEGFAHPRCYLRGTNGCSHDISGEHYISESLLHKIESTNSTIDIAGVRWLPREHLKSIGKAALTAKILCAKHNSDLSPLDSEIANFSGHVSEIDAEFLKPNPAKHEFKLNGAYVERWILKTMIGLVESNQVMAKSGRPYCYKEECIRLLCSPFRTWPNGWGLYFSLPSGPVHHSRSFEFVPLSNPDTDQILAVNLKFNGIGAVLVMGKADRPAEFGTLRPANLVFKRERATSIISFDWGKANTGAPLLFTHSGTYQGLAPGHDLPRAD